MNRLLLIFCLVLVAAGLFGQNRVDTVKLRCRYEQYGVMDTTNMKLAKKDIMVLDIGSELSRYYSIWHYFQDSISKIYLPIRIAMVERGASSKELQDLSNKQPRGPAHSGTHDYTIVKEFSKNKLHLADRIGFDNYHYEEEIPVLEWELGDDTLTVCGYPCKKARTAFRGRNYEAWYAPEIPVSLGPWKFAGLPGMILQIRDTRNMFRFVCTQITIPEEAALMDIEHIISKKRFNLVKKSKYVEDKQKFMDNAGAFVTGSPVIRQNGPLPPHNYVKKPFNPIELTED